jgi:hypothetical protein
MMARRIARFNPAMAKIFWGALSWSTRRGLWVNAAATAVIAAAADVPAAVVIGEAAADAKAAAVVAAGVAEAAVVAAAGINPNAGK